MKPSPETIETTRKLVDFQTTATDSNLPLIDFVAERLAPYAQIRILPDPTGQKANLFASIGPEKKGGIILSGHSDVVPARNKDEWRHDPFDAGIVGDRLFGRGACDMKSFLGVVIGLAPKIAALPLKKPVHIAVSYDEEIGCIGVWGIADMIREEGLVFDGCVVGEPTLMAPIIGHKGKTSWLCEVHGRSAHSSLAPKGVNAVEIAAGLISTIVELADFRRWNGPFDQSQDPPHSTLSTGPIAGGTQLNVVPDYCRFEFEMRYLPQDPPGPVIETIRAAAERLEEEARRRAPEASITIRETNAYPGFDIAGDAPFVRLIEKLSGHKSAGRVAFGTEAGIFAGLGIPTIVCGPGSITEAHIVDEYIALDQIAECEAFVMALAETLCRGD